MLENDLETQCVNWIESLGGLAVKVTVPSRRGWLDRMILLDGLVLFVELKRPDGNGKVSPHQKKIIQDLTERGYAATVIYSFGEFKAFVDSAKESRL